MAVIHHRFESIHPFYDGKQKIARNNFYINKPLFALVSEK